MPQPLINEAGRFLGPFRGINTSRDQAGLTPAWAIDAMNCLVQSGSIVPRAPWVAAQWNPPNTPVHVRTPLVLGGRLEKDAQGQNTGRMLSNGIGNRIKSMHYVSGIGLLVQTDPSDGDFLSRLWLVNPPFTVQELTAQLPTTFPVDVVPYRGVAYIILSGPTQTARRIMRTEGTQETTYFAGITPPNADAGDDRSVEVGIQSVAVNPVMLVAATFRYAFSFYDTRTGIESNAIFSGTAGGLPTDATEDFEIAAAVGVHVRIRVDKTGTPPRVPLSGEKWDTLRIYRRNMTIGAVGYRLLQEVPFPEPSTGFIVDSLTEDQLDETGISSRETGPFAPTRNGVPRINGSCGDMWKERLWVNDVDDPGVLRFSAIGKPDYMDPDDTRDISGDVVDRISGIRATGDQLLVGKPRNIWTLSGDVFTATNLTNAVGAVPLESTLRSYRTPATVGPMTKWGNGFLVAGAGVGTPRVLFAASEGLFAADGVSTACLSDDIRALWGDFVREAGESGGEEPTFSMADNAAEGALYIIGQTFNTHIGRGLIYSYRAVDPPATGGWTRFDGGDHIVRTYGPVGVLLSEAYEINVIPTAVAAVPVPGFDQRRLVVGGLLGTLQFALSPNRAAAAGQQPGRVPGWFWLTPVMPLVRGLRVHVYQLKVLASAELAVSGGSPARHRISLRPDGDDTITPSAGTLGLDSRRMALIPIRREMHHYQLRFAKDSATAAAGHRPGFGIAGWEADVQIVGKR